MTLPDQKETIGVICSACKQTGIINITKADRPKCVQGDNNTCMVIREVLMEGTSY